ncbi:MAG: GAF domain-containing protein [Rhodothermaceae bacterium]|nr:GAF domain-containing protein [Rhodothermaceae bacterium]
MDTIIRTLVRRSLEAVGAAQGVVTLLPRTESASASTLVRTVMETGEGTALRPDEALLAWMDGHRQPLRLTNAQTDPTFGQFDWDPSVRSVLCVPLVSHARFLGVLSLFNKHDEDGFTDDDVRLLTILGMQSAQVIDAAQVEEERDRILNLFGRHTAPSVVEELLRHEAEPPSRRAHVCVMFFDLRDFSAFAEQAEPEAVVDYLNTVFGLTTEAVTERGGIIHQLLGDGFMAVFGVPIAYPDYADRAVEAALDIVARIERECTSGRLRPTKVGIGLHAGEVVAGTVGSSQHKEYKITGDVVNVAARIEQFNKDFDSQLLVSETVWQQVKAKQHRADSLGAVPVRGRAEPLVLYCLA